MKRGLKRVAKRLLVQAHRAALRAGVVVLPNHYYVPIADLNVLERTRERWARRSPMTGIDVDLRRQAALLREMVAPFLAEYAGNDAMRHATALGFGPGFGFIEAQCLHGVLRALKPRRIVEVGSGISTYCAVKATELNAAEGRPAEITCVEPHPSAYLRRASGIRLVGRPVESLDPAEFDRLDAGDFLFIDSSHAVRPGGDVLYLYLQVLPRLRPGVVVHIHDVFFPYLHQRDLLESPYQWAETALLQALLTGNPRLGILFSLSMLHYDAPEVLKGVFPAYAPAPGRDGLGPVSPGHFPSSTYLRSA